MLCSVEAECYCLYHKSGNGGDTQSVENQVEQEEEPAEGYFITYHHTYIWMFSCSCINALLNYSCWFRISMAYLPFNVDFVTFSVTSHHSTEVSWRVGFCMYVYEKVQMNTSIYAVMCKPCSFILKSFFFVWVMETWGPKGGKGLREGLRARVQTIVLYAMFCGTCLELPQVMFVWQLDQFE